jgi:hypothetical protein
MSYTKHNWANGQSGADAPGWLNNAEEGIRAAVAQAETTGAGYDAANANSVYRHAQALRTDAQAKAAASAGYLALATQAQNVFNARNSMLVLTGGTAVGPGSAVILNGSSRYTIGSFPYQSVSSSAFKVTMAGYYMFQFNMSIYGPEATMRIYKNGVSFERIKLINYPDVSFAQEIAIVSANVVRYLEAGAQIHFGFELASGASVWAFKATVRRL